MKRINLNGVIGNEIMSKDITDQLNTAKGDSVEVFLHSPGGSVMEGLAIYNAFRDYKRSYPFSQMSLSIKGVAASMASYVAVNPSFDHVSAEDNAVVMMHNPTGLVLGDYRDAEKMADILSNLANLLALAYSAKIKKPQKEVREMMDAETWFFGDEIKDAGFVNEIIKTEETKDKSTAIASAKYDFSAMSEKISGKKDSIERIAAMLSVTPINEKTIAYYKDINRTRLQAGLQPLTPPPVPQPAGTPDGTINTQADLTAEVRRTREMLGLSV